MQALLAVGVVALVVILVVAAGAFVVLRWGEPLVRVAMEAVWSGKGAAIEERIQALEADVAELPRTWKELTDDAKKKVNQARWHIKRVKEELEDRGLADDHVDRLDGTLHLLDGAGSEDGGVHELSGDVGEAPVTEDDPITIALRHKWHG